MKTVNIPTRADRFQGVIIWAALGDALGAPWELRYKAKGPFYTQPGSIDNNLVYPIRLGKYKHAVGEQPFTEYPAAMVTDDTSMTNFLINDIIAHNGVYSGRAVNTTSTGTLLPQGVTMTTGDIVISYMMWASGGYYRTGGNNGVLPAADHLVKGCPFMGNNTRQLLKITVNKQGTADFKINKYEYRFINNNYATNSMGNGCLMRAAPLCIYPVPPLDQPAICDIDCRITNNNYYCIVAVRLYMIMLRKVINEPAATATDIIKECFDYVAAQPTQLQDHINYLYRTAYNVVHAQGVPPTQYSTKYDAKAAQTINFEFPGVVKEIFFLPWKGSCAAGIWSSFYGLILSDHIMNTNNINGYDLSNFNKNHHHNMAIVFERIISLKGDTDSDCKIAGALIGARYGLTALRDGQIGNLFKMFNVNTTDIGNFQNQAASLAGWYQ